MSIAQKLYEGLPIGERGPVGLITYMRTDSIRCLARSPGLGPGLHRQEIFGRPYPPASSGLQEQEPGPGRPRSRPAHDLRPLARRVKPYLKPEEYRLYELIWRRFMASQMSPAIVEETEFGIKAGRYLFTVKGEVMKFAGYTAVYPNRENGDKETLPPASRGRSSLSTASGSSRSRASPSLPPASPRARWSRSSRPRGSDGRRPTRRSSPRSRTGPTSTRTRASSSRPSSAFMSPISWSRTSPT